jgi:hypothetical protein
MTVFLGGLDNIFQIATFDWVTKKYKIQDSRLKEGRWLSSCAVLNDKSGNLLVAIVGGEFSSSLEAWNPQDGSVTKLADLPTISNSIENSQLISINNKTELLLYGGYAIHNGSEYYHDEIWNYKSGTNKWSELKKMWKPRYSFVVLPVLNLACEGSQ